jgi:hypothetical protein
VLGGYFRYNFNQRVGARFMVLAGQVAGKGPLQGVDWEFEKSVMDISFQAEINYLKYMIGNKKAWFTSYLTAGAGVMFYSPDQENILNIWYFNPFHPVAGTQGSGVSNQPVTALTFPFGMGFKLNAGKRMGIGIEYQMRKIFDDKLDDLDDPLSYKKNGETVKYTDFIHNNDWAGFLGLHITYKIYTGGKPCPAYDSKN